MQLTQHSAVVCKKSAAVIRDGLLCVEDRIHDKKLLVEGESIVSRTDGFLI